MSLRNNHFAGVKRRALKRPGHLDPPDYLSKFEPVPAPEAGEPANAPQGEPERLDPTRYGDWEKKGIAVDF